jgi:hypothetical protein
MNSRHHSFWWMIQVFFSKSKPILSDASSYGTESNTENTEELS